MYKVHKDTVAVGRFPTKSQASWGMFPTRSQLRSKNTMKPFYMFPLRYIFFLLESFLNRENPQ